MRFLLMLLLPMTLCAQKIKVNETDKSTGQHRVETDFVVLKSGTTQHLQATLRSVDSTYFLSFTGAGFGVGAVSAKNAFLFLMEDGSTVTIYPTGVQSFEVSNGGRWFNHQYRISAEQLGRLASGTVESVRKYYDQTYDDMEVKGEPFTKACALFLKTVSR